jgi:simple sugar transport system ATP-binding protein
MGIAAAELRGVSKRFLNFTALDSVDFSVNPGEVHALMGENGAGKSTLIKVLTGVHPPDGGQILLNGSPIHPKSPDAAVKLGISTVYQEVNLVPNLSVAENICLGREPKGVFGIKWGALYRHAESAIRRVGIDCDVRRPLGTCSIAIQQMVSIARAVDVDAKILVLDEPTSSLDRQEVDQLFAIVRRLKEQGLGIVFITHFLDQVYEMADRVTVLRNGKVAGVWSISDLSRVELVTQMLGRDASGLEGGSSAKLATVPTGLLLEASGLGRSGAVEGVDCRIGRGEVWGIAGLLGSGRTETLRLFFGLDSPDRGSLSFAGQILGNFGPRKAIRLGMAFCPEDRKLEGICAELSVRENIVLALQAKNGLFRTIPVNRQREIASQLAERLKLSPPDVERPIGTLSGGNQQKAMLARWLVMKPDLLLLDEPTRGIDIGAKFEIMGLIDELTGQGMGVVFVSSELPEMVRTCSKLLVLRDRKLVSTLEAGDITEQNIIELIAGGGT